MKFNYMPGVINSVVLLTPDTDVKELERVESYEWELKEPAEAIEHLVKYLDWIDAPIAVPTAKRCKDCPAEWEKLR